MNKVMIRYRQIPSWTTWKKDSNVKDIFVTRKSDPVLSRIDNLIKAIESTSNAAENLYLRFELFFATNFWLDRIKRKHTMFKMRSEREPAMWALFSCNAHALAKGFGVGIQALANTIELHFGRTMSEHGRQMDQQDFHYFRTQAEREKFKIFFKDGQAYQLPWREIFSKTTSLDRAKPILANSSVVHDQTSGDLQTTLNYNPDSNPRDGHGWAFFVMGMNRELYMTPHQKVMNKSGPNSRRGRVSKYHSSIMAGMAVTCAGSILIEKGYIKGIENDSGHYQPINLSLVSALHQFEMMGVPLEGITVYDFCGVAHANGKDFLASHGNWSSVRQRKLRNDPKRRAFETEVKEKYFGTLKKTKLTLRQAKSKSLFKQLVGERYLALAKQFPHHYPRMRWEMAHRDVALTLGEEKREFWDRAAGEPIPFEPPSPVVAQRVPRRRPPKIPDKVGRPKAIHT